MFTSKLSRSSVFLQRIVRIHSGTPIIRLERKGSLLAHKSIWKTIYKSSFHTNNSLCETVQFNLSDIGEGISEVVIKEWFVVVGDKVNQFEPICEVQSDKASVTITSRFDGKISKIYYQVEDTARVGMPLIDVDLIPDGTESSDSSDSSSSEEKELFPSTSDTERENFNRSNKVLTTPAVRRLAAENKIDLSEVKATGKEGRVLKEDVLKYLGDPRQLQKKDFPSVSRSPDLPKTHIHEPKTSPSLLEPDRTVPIVGIQKAMAKTMTKSLTIPHLGLSDEVDLKALVEMKARLKRVAERRNIKLSYVPFFVKATSLALLKYPLLNTSVDDKCENLIYKSSHNIGIAMDTKLGLLVPNIKNVQNLSILEVASELNRLQALGNDGKLGTNELTGGTFTLSNIGSVGGLFGIPVIVSPEVVIGALGRINVLPRFDENDAIIKGHIMNVLWSADHRVIDGATMTRFSTMWKMYLEYPHIMMVDLK